MLVMILVKIWVQKMFQIDRRKIVPAFLLAVLLLTALLTGCGSRQSNTGSFSSRLIDEKGDAVINAKCFSLFAEDQIVYSGLDGSFRLPELPAGLNNIIIQHNDFALEQYQSEVKSDQETKVDFIRLDRLNASNRISKVTVGEVSSTTAEINWQTYKDICCNIHYGTSTNYDTYVTEERPNKTHFYKLTGLKPETVYHFKVQYLDEFAASYSSYDYSFRTASGEAPYKPASIKIANMTELGVVPLTWTAPAIKLSVAGYNVYRQKKGGAWTRCNGTVITKDCSYSDVEAETGVFCRYAVTAVNNVGAESEKVISDLIFVPGVVKNDINISKLDSPVKLTADLIIPMGINMTVEPGVEFQISESDSFNSGFDTDRVEILVHGALTVNGTEAEPVIFTPLDGSGKREHWAGITILSSQTGISSIRNAELFGCSGYTIDVKSVNVAVSGISIKHSVGGVRFEGVTQAVDVENCFFDDISSVAVSINKCFHMTLKNSRITNASVGVENFTDSIYDQTFIRNTDIYAYDTGIRGTFANSIITNTLVVSPQGINYTNILRNDGGNIIDHVTVDADNAVIIATGSLYLTNNIFANTSNSGVTGISYMNESQYPTYCYNDIHGFASPVYGCDVGTLSVALDPAFVGGSPYDYNLSDSSLCRINDEFGLELGRYGVTRK